MKTNKSVILAGTALAGTAVVSLFMATAAMAQSTASQEIEVVVKGSKKGAGPVDKETGIKSKTTINQDYIATLPAGQNITAALNIVPGYFYENNDPFGSSGGTVHIRGIGSDRISLTFDGIQLNDAGNYAIYPNQQLDPELIQSASVATGGTDVDSMSASAAGGTINYVTIKPAQQFGVLTSLSGGSDNFHRFFGKLDTGKFGPWGTTAFFSYSDQYYDTFTTDNGKLHKDQYNFRVYQPLDNGSFMSVAGNFNRNRNRFIFNQTMATFLSKGFRYGSAGLTNINPSNTGNIRGQSKWVINDHLFVTVDPAYQYVLANGGGSSSVNEKTGKIGSWINANFVNFDANHDGTIGTDSIYNPNTTQTDRFSVTSSAVYTFPRGDVLRFGVSFDRGRTRQTGDGIFLSPDGTTPNVFGAKLAKSLAILGKDGTPYERRNRFSNANVDVFSLQYRGRYFDDKLFLDLGLRSQKMERLLNQYCYSRAEDASGSFQPFCTTQSPTSTNANGTVNFAGNTGTWIKPYKTKVDFQKVLPKVGVTYAVSANGQVFANYSEAMSSPKTDDYYAVTVNASNQIAIANPLPELTKTEELGYRYNSGKVTASVVAWATRYDNRIVSTYDPTTDTYQDRNIGSVDLSGIEGSYAIRPIEPMSLYANLSYTHSKVLSDEFLGKDSAGKSYYLPIKGKQVVDTPDWMSNLGMSYKATQALSFTLAGKYVGERFATDTNEVKLKSYVTADASIRYDLTSLVPSVKNAYLQLNGSNILGARYFLNGTGTQATTISTYTDPLGKTLAAQPSYYRGAPTTYMLTLQTQF
jgi:iron complex outermembrane receptor protein